MTRFPRAQEFWRRWVLSLNGLTEFSNERLASAATALRLESMLAPVSELNLAFMFGGPRNALPAPFLSVGRLHHPVACDFVSSIRLRE